MPGIMLNPTKEGLKLIADDFEIVIDPAENFKGICDGFFISNIYSSNNKFHKYNSPVFVPDWVKKLTLHKSTTDEFIVSCTSGDKHTLRKNGKRILNFTFIEFKDNPCSGVLMLETKDNIVVYSSETSIEPNLIPPCDTLIINGKVQTPLKSLLKTITDFNIEISHISNLYGVINSLNSYAPDNTVGVDHTVLEVACHFLKNNCTVFSKAVKPLSSFAELPPVIITTTPEQYPHRPVIPDSVFTPELSLSDIYSFASTAPTEKTIAVLSDYHGKRQRGNLTICGTGNIFEL